jgi:ribosomal protein L11 methyltransferase
MAAAVQITARGPLAAVMAAAEAIEADPALEAAAWSMVEEDEARRVWRIDAFPSSAGEARDLETALASDLLIVTRAQLADADWVALSLSGLPPVRAGRFFVFGAHDRGRVPKNVIPLRIEAGAAFGTGHHDTTLGCLLEFDALRRRRRFRRVLDLGAGTGVLAIAAAKTGARRVVGIDIDPRAVAVARENARLNGASGEFTLADHPIGRGYDLIFANILAAPLIALAPRIARALAPGGVVILSGLLRGQARAVRARFLGAGLRAERRRDLGPWATLVMRRRG